MFLQNPAIAAVTPFATCCCMVLRLPKKRKCLSSPCSAAASDTVRIRSHSSESVHFGGLRRNLRQFAMDMAGLFRSIRLYILECTLFVQYFVGRSCQLPPSGINEIFLRTSSLDTVTSEKLGQSGVTRNNAVPAALAGFIFRSGNARFLLIVQKCRVSGKSDIKPLNPA